MTEVNCAIIGSGNISTDILFMLVTTKSGLAVHDLLVALARMIAGREDMIENTAIDMRRVVR